MSSRILFPPPVSHYSQPQRLLCVALILVISANEPFNMLKGYKAYGLGSRKATCISSGLESFNKINKNNLPRWPNDWQNSEEVDTRSWKSWVVKVTHRKVFLLFPGFAASYLRACRKRFETNRKKLLATQLQKTGQWWVQPKTRNGLNQVLKQVNRL